MLRSPAAPRAPVLGPLSAASRSAACARPRPPPAATPGPDSGVDGGGDLDVGLFVTRTKKKEGGAEMAANAAVAPPPPPPPPSYPPPSAELPKELRDAGVTAIHTNLPIPGATRSGPGKTADTPAGRYPHSAMTEGGAGFWHRATNNAATAPRMFWDRLGDGFSWRNKPVRSSGEEGKPAFVPAKAKAKAAAADKKGFGSAAGPASPTSAPSSWFPGGTTSLTWNAVDRHVEAKQGDRLALVGVEGAGAEAGSLTFAAARAAAAGLGAWLGGPAGLSPGDTVAVLLPPGPTAGVAALAASRAGCGLLSLDPSAATATLAASLAAGRPRVVVTSSPLKPAVDAAIAEASSSWTPDTVLVYEQGESTVAATPWACGRDVWAHAALPAEENPVADPVSAQPSWVASDAPALLLPSSTAPSTLFIHPAAGYCVGAGAAARLAWDVRAGDGVAVTSPPGTPVAALAFWGALLNCAAAVSLPALAVEGPAEEVASSASAWWRAAAAARATHAIAGSAAAARALAAADPAAITAAVATGLRLVTLCSADPDPAAVRALEAALPDSVALTASWLPDGAGTPPLAGIPGPAAPTTPPGLRPFLRSAKDWSTSWPASARAAVPAGAWKDALLNEDGTFSHAGCGWGAVEGEDGEVVWEERA